MRPFYTFSKNVSGRAGSNCSFAHIRVTRFSVSLKLMMLWVYPGITKGQHWHNTKWEFFIVVSGHGLIQERRVGSEDVLEFEVTGDKPQAIHMLPGYTHNIINLSETENLVTLMWANEPFDANHPDTFFEKV